MEKCFIVPKTDIVAIATFNEINSVQKFLTKKWPAAWTKRFRSLRYLSEEDFLGGLPETIYIKHQPESIEFRCNKRVVCLHIPDPIKLIEEIDQISDVLIYTKEEFLAILNECL